MTYAAKLAGGEKEQALINFFNGMQDTGFFKHNRLTNKIDFSNETSPIFTLGQRKPNLRQNES